MQASDLDGIVEDRANVLEIVSERLSKHVLANYDTFVRGINEAASVEADLQVTPPLPPVPLELHFDMTTALTTLYSLGPVQW